MQYFISSVIVIRVVQCTGNKNIVKCYTQKQGVQSYMVYMGKKNNLNRALFQPLIQLELEYEHKNKKALPNIKLIKPQIIYPTLVNDVYKKILILLISEVLNVCLQEKQQDKHIFSFIQNTTKSLDECSEHKELKMFHLRFMFDFTRYLGFYPNLQNEHLSYFDLQEGECVKIKPNHNNYISKSFILILSDFSRKKRRDYTKQEKDYITRIILQYYKLHIENFIKPKSFQILQDIFQ